MHACVRACMHACNNKLYDIKYSDVSCSAYLLGIAIIFLEYLLDEEKTQPV